MNAEQYVDEAEKVILSLRVPDRRGSMRLMLTTSKIRNLLAMTADIYNEVSGITGDKLPDSICERIDYLRVRFTYEAGRERAVNEFVKKANILEELKKINKSKKNYILFNRYMEALVAFHKYYGGQD